MNILYINHYAGSPQHGMEYRPYYLAREWVRSGHAVRMLAGGFSHVRAQQPDLAALRTTGAVPDGRSTAQVIDGIAYHWYATPAYGGNGLGRVKNIWAFLRQVWLDAPRIALDFQPDVVIASSTYPMDIWVAHRIVRLARRQGIPCKLVFEVHDLWPLSPIELGGMSPKHPFIMLCQAAENYAYRHADVVVSMLPKVAGHMQAHGLDLRKLHIVPNGIALEEWQGDPAPLREDLVRYIAAQKAAGRKVVLTNGCFDLLHAGHIAYLRQARALGDALVVALNSDASVRELKGAGRPLNPQDDRAMLCGSPSMLDETSEVLNSFGLKVSPRMREPGDYLIERAFVEK